MYRASLSRAAALAHRATRTAATHGGALRTAAAAPAAVAAVRSLRLPNASIRRFSSSSSSNDAGAAFPASTSASSGAAADAPLDAESEAEFARLMSDMQSKFGGADGAEGGAAGGAMPNMDELMKQMEKMGIKMDSTGIGAADAAAGVGKGSAEAAAARAAAEAAQTAKFNVQTRGTAQQHEFKSEVKQILDIMANSLYTDHEVFIRELISNASDALEKLRYLRNATAGAKSDTVTPTRDLAIRIHTNEAQKLLVIEDNGIGMTAEELQSHLGVIARSGSKAFMKDLESQGKGGKDTSNIIGQFGVGFYSVFMVADKIDVISQSSKLDPATGKPYPAHLWSSDGNGTYQLTPIESTGETGTTLRIHLKDKFKEFATPHALTTVVQKYSNFVGFPIEINGEKLNSTGALWLESKDSVTPAQHEAFYRHLSHAYDTPTYTLHFHIDAPLSLHGLFYFPEKHMEKYGMGRMEMGASLYSRKVLIKSKSKDVLPEWLRFVKGVADSEDIPLNVSRENMQDSRLIAKISGILVKKILKFLEDEAKRDPKKYNTWFAEFGNFLKEGVCTEYRLAPDIARLLRFESSATKPGETISLDDYISRMQPDQKGIFYLSTPNASFARSSPYFESFASKNVEVLFLYQNIDEFVMNSLQSYNKRSIISIEKADATTDSNDKDASKDDKAKDKAAESVPETAELISFMKGVLGDKVSSITVTSRLVHSPAAIFDHESGAVRRLMKMVDAQGTAQKSLSRQKLEINPTHPTMRQLLAYSRSQPAVAALIVDQLFDNCLIAADMLDQPRSMLDRINKIIEHVVSNGAAATPQADYTSSSSSTPAKEAEVQKP